MGPEPGFSHNDLQTWMTLSALAYTDETQLKNESREQQLERIRRDLGAALRNPAFATSDEWLIAWGPALSSDRSNLIYVAKQRGAARFVIVVRGTDWSFITDWYEDGDVILMTNPWQVSQSDPYNEIAVGSHYGVHRLSSLRSTHYLVGEAPEDDRTGVALSPISAWQFLQAQARRRGPIAVGVTGHSLGGCLANLLAVKLDFDLALAPLPIALSSITFAAPTAGNNDYANYCQQRFGSLGLRVYNDFDLVPRGWSDVGSIPDLYSPTIACPLPLRLLFDSVYEGLELSGADYTQPDPSLPLSSAINLSWPDFCQQVAFQHSAQTYLTLLGAPNTAASGGFAKCPLD